MSIFLSTLLNSLQSYGYPALWLSIFVAAVGLPLPIGLVLLAAGAFAALGDFNVIVLALIATSASVAGNSPTAHGPTVPCPRAALSSRITYQ